MAQVAAARLRATGAACLDILRQTHAARLAIMAARLRRPLPLLAMLMLAALLLCLFLGWSSARGVFRALSPAGIGAGVAAAAVGLLVLELCAAFAVTLMRAGLQLACDTGRHRIRALLVIASGLGLVATARQLTAEGPAFLSGALLPILGLCALISLTIWFERAYRRPAYPGFRDFWADVVTARHILMRAAHGE
ncbi:hypothetical protein [Bosea sp. (in: a-proteobacteria)]|uniref:hypothetical protein n=1 Tax=Bosea sp. (in: a-proteobacteria) TaxID=1871050 RepID=UPI00262634AA|nr:hypothetical protein [Bosea sp. (in: a-proteobacteria)]MCO5092607.1 hypothetical protein [Bosea sp. (in: a-proteobacteria)]